MKKIRINELARELEVKPSRIIDLLPELGVQEKKTHSSSIDEDVALIIKQRFSVEPNGDSDFAYSRSSGDDVVIEGGDEPIPEEPGTLAPPPDIEEEEQEPVQREEPQQQAAEPPAVKVTPTPLRPPIAGVPLNPPVRTQPTIPPPAPTIPLPPSRPAAPAPPAATAPVSPGTPAQPQAPSAPSGPGAPVARPPIAAKNVPIYRPGQVLSGPRQPMPAGVGRPAAPPPPAPGAPAPRPPRQTPPAGITIPRPQAPQAPQQPLQQGRPVLAGQPAARPVVPPRPDLVARLQQQQARPMPGQAAPPAPRPGMPTRPSSPVPGQPIYRGPIRPGQPVMRGPGQPGPGGPGGPPGRPRGPRPMHPTSPLRAEPAQMPTETQRRLQGKPGARPTGDRKRDMEGKLIAPSRRQQEPIAPPPIDREITIGEGITVKELSEKLGVKSNLVIKKLVDRKIFATINQSLDLKLAEDLARDFGASTTHLSYEEQESWEIEMAEEEKDIAKRAPVVTIMGHVDHGKTSLLDAIRSANVAAKEAGGITQHIGAYQINRNGQKIVFIDTPGHEAFTRMRARGAKVTDIVVLVVAADDGVMPQTIEAIDHARAAKVPILVAINKIDRPDAQIDRIKQQLSDRGLLAEDWGGDTVMVPVSAKTQQNLDLLLEMILLVSELTDLKSNASRPGIGTVLEAQLDRGRGPVATVLVQNGTLRVGDFFICGQVFGKVRAMYNDRGEQVREAEPSTPVEVIGLDALPDVGDGFQVVTDTSKAKQIVMYREARAREQALAKNNRITLEMLHEQAKEGEVKELNIILKTDVGGTAEVLSDMLQKLSTDKVKIRVLSKNVGAITERDVLLATTSNAIIIGFNVRPEKTAAVTAEHEGVDIRLHTIIYELTDEIKKAMTGLLEPTIKEVFKGRAEVREVFRITKVGTVAGCMVTEGVLTRASQVRLLRDNVVVHTGRIDALKRFKDDVSEVKTGFECGVSLAGYNDIKSGDVIEAFIHEKVAAVL